jgi:hypothetical protein
MAVTVVGLKEAFVIEPEVGLIGDWFIEPLRNHPRYKAVLAKCGNTEIAFYRNMIRDAVDKEGRVERIIQHLERQSIDVVVVERERTFANVDCIRFIGGGRDYGTTMQQIVRVDSSIDAEIVQRALDHGLTSEEPMDVETKLNQLLAIGVLKGKLTKIEY